MVELYQLRLEHCLVDDEGGHHQLEEPLVVGMAVDMRYHQASFCINSMFDRMREELLRRSIDNDGNNNSMHHFPSSGGKTAAEEFEQKHRQYEWLKGQSDDEICFKHEQSQVIGGDST